jgi:hypothetical protein
MNDEKIYPWTGRPHSVKVDSAFVEGMALHYCENNLDPDDWGFFGLGFFYFRNETEAVMFKLRFG